MNLTCQLATNKHVRHFFVLRSVLEHYGPGSFVATHACCWLAGWSVGASEVPNNAPGYWSVVLGTAAISPRTSLSDFALEDFHLNGSSEPAAARLTNTCTRRPARLKPGLGSDFSYISLYCYRLPFMQQ